MTIVAGIDEAGYGPTLGPMVVAATVFRIADSARETALNRLMSLSEKAGGLPLGDSKQLYRSRSDLPRIELSVLGHAALGRRALPLSVARLLDDAVDLHHDEVEELPWYRGRLFDTGLPRAAPVEEILGRTARQAEILADREISFLDFHVAPVIETRFNHMVRHYGSKAWPLFLATGRLIDRLMERHRDEPLVVHVDRQGGRTRYGELLQGYFPLAPLRTVRERREQSVYQLELPDRPVVRLHFHVNGDASRTPVALASLVAKTVRELFMESLNGWFAEQVPGLRPTAGYSQDAKRFLKDVSRTLDRKAPRSQLIRIR
jgi:ribonuclease HII